MCHAFSFVLLFSVLLIFVQLELCLRNIFKRHKEHEVHWVRKWGYWGREKSMIKLYSMQKNFKRKELSSASEIRSALLQRG